MLKSEDMAESKDYFARNEGIINKEQRAYYAKIQKNQQAGLAAFSSGDYVPFSGWKPDISERTFDITLELDGPSKSLIVERVVEPLTKLAGKYGIKAIYPGKGDLPPHVVMQAGIFRDLNPEQINQIRNWLLSDNSHFNRLSAILEGLTFHHGSLVMAPSSYVCASYFDMEQGTAFRARKIMEKVLVRALDNFKSLSQTSEGNVAPTYSYLDIFHSSVMRLTEKAPAEALLAFSNEAYSTVGEDLNRDPLPVKVNNLFRGLAKDFRNQVPGLLVPE